MDDAEIAAMIDQDLLDGRIAFTWGHLLDVVADWLPPGSTAAYVERIAEDIACGPALVELRGADPATEVEFSTPAVLAAVQQRVVDRAADRNDAGLGVAGEDEVASVLVRRPELPPEHAVAVGDLATSGRAVDVLVHRDAADKFAVLEAAGAAWQRWGPRVLAAAPTEDAAAELQRETDVVTSPVDELLADAEYPRAGGGGLPRGLVLLVDDANLLPDHTLTRLLDAAARYDTKTVLVADARLSAPDGDSGTFGAIAAAVEPVTAHRPHERATTGREVPQEADDLPPYLRGIVAAREAERTWLLRRIAREETRLTELHDARDALAPWQRAQRRDLADRLTIADDALGAARSRLATVERDLRSLDKVRHSGDPRTPSARSVGITREPHTSRRHTSGDPDERAHQRETETRGHGRGGR